MVVDVSLSFLTDTQSSALFSFDVYPVKAVPPPHYSLHVPGKRLVSIDTLGQLLKSPDLFFWCGRHMKTEGEGDDAVL